jgi:hypothetical protein
MTNLKHIILSNLALSGLEYGMLRDFEDEIIRLTNGHQVEMPRQELPKFIEHRIGHGTRYSGFRRLIPKAQCELKADILWVVLMGPENFSLDLFKNWDRGVGIKILYLFDTFESQLPSIKRVLASTKWDFTITSFQGAIPFLEEHTQRKWYTVAQGVKLERFKPVVQEQKVINFCAYGRRLEKVHNSIKDYCLQTENYYDYTTAASVQSQLHPREYYGQYAWHLNHSFFTFCWPVELTHPKRVLTFSPITCRWFEAAASGTIILGQAPNDPFFNKIFGSELVIPIDYKDSEKNLFSKWEHIWENRHYYLHKALKTRELLSQSWSWENRVKEILNLIDCNS